LAERLKRIGGAGLPLGVYDRRELPDVASALRELGLAGGCPLLVRLVSRRPAANSPRRLRDRPQLLAEFTLLLAGTFENVIVAHSFASVAFLPVSVSHRFTITSQ
jgi:hypothetical protein